MECRHGVLIDATAASVLLASYWLEVAKRSIFILSVLSIAIRAEQNLEPGLLVGFSLGLQGAPG